MPGSLTQTAGATRRRKRNRVRLEAAAAKQQRKTTTATITVAAEEPDVGATTDSNSSDNWAVVRCGAKDRKTREKQGGQKSPQSKCECSSLEVLAEGVVGTSTASWGLFSWLHALLGKEPVKHHDFNSLRTHGLAGVFVPNTLDRAVSLVTMDVYKEMKKLHPGIQHGDLGENLLLSGAHGVGKSCDFAVGTKIKIGEEVVIELTEANKPCYRLGYAGHWAAEAKQKFGAKWWLHPGMIVSPEHPGGRGWLAKVLVPGTTKPGDTVCIV